MWHVYWPPVVSEKRTAQPINAPCRLRQSTSAALSASHSLSPDVSVTTTGASQARVSASGGDGICGTTGDGVEPAHAFSRQTDAIRIAIGFIGQLLE